MLISPKCLCFGTLQLIMTLRLTYSYLKRNFFFRPLMFRTRACSHHSQCIFLFYRKQEEKR